MVTRLLPGPRQQSLSPPWNPPNHTQPGTPLPFDGSSSLSCDRNGGMSTTSRAGALVLESSLFTAMRDVTAAQAERMNHS